MCYYPTEFIAAMLNSVMGDSEKVAYYIRFANECGIQVLPPDINESYAKFTVKDDKIRFGLAAVKNVGKNVIDSIVMSRQQKGKFKDLVDFCNKIDISCINKRVVESLIKAGAYDCLKVYRSRMLAVYEKILDSISSDRKKNISGQINLFTDLDNSAEFSSIEIKYPEIKEFDKKYILSMEKEMTGLYISGHPLEEYEDVLKKAVSTSIIDLVTTESLEDGDTEINSRIKDGSKVIIGGIISSVSKKVTRKNDMMAFIVVEDLYSSIEVVVFPKVLEKYKSLLVEDGIVLITGRVSIREEEQPKILCEEIRPLIKSNFQSIYILVEENKMVRITLEELKPLLKEYKGDIPIYICTNKERKKYLIDKEFWVDGSIDILSELRKKIGDQNLKAV